MQIRDTNSAELRKVFCNQCGREMRVENGWIREGHFFGENSFGYFSHKDGQRHRFDLCEDCYDALNRQFLIPSEIVENEELL